MEHLLTDRARLERPFARLGLRVKFDAPTPHPFRAPPDFSVDVGRDRRGEHFLLRVNPRADLEVQALDVRPDLDQLLLLVRQEGRKDKFLCGLDERHLFTAAVPGAGVRDVRSAMDALKPAHVRHLEARAGLRTRDRLRRRNLTSVRQGEWFFVPVSALVVPPERVRRSEPLTRGPGSKPHVCEQAARLGGEVVWLCRRHPRPLLARQLEVFLRGRPEARSWAWEQRVRNPELFVRGAVRHPDHATLHLPVWHRVLMNTEGEASGAHHVTFLD